MAIPLLKDLAEEIKIHSSYVETECTVVSAELVVHEGSSTSSRNRGREFTYHPRIRLLHSANVTASGFSSRNYERDLDGDRARQLVEMYAAGKRVPCFYDPGHPARAVLINEWGDRRRYLLLIPSLGAMIFGALMAFVMIKERV